MPLLLLLLILLRPALAALLHGLAAAVCTAVLTHTTLLLYSVNSITTVCYS
jgi:hypothetical protein